MKIFLDMDNVLFDFDKEINRRGLTREPNSLLAKQHVDKSLWSKDEIEFDLQLQVMMSEPGFFRNLPLMEGADKLWIAAGPRPSVLTARPKNPESAQRVRQEKRDSLEEHFGQVSDDRFICCLRSEKKDYATGMEHGSSFPYQNILVDDLEWNCSEWEKAGGIAIHFRTMDQAIKDLTNVLAN